MIAAQRLRKGACNSVRGALLWADSAFYGQRAVSAALRAGAQVSVTLAVRAAIATIGEDAWTAIDYTDALFDEDTGQWVSRAEVAEIAFTAVTSKAKKLQIPGRLVVGRFPDLTPTGDGLFQVWRFHAFFTTSTLDIVTADKTHRGHAVIEQVHADLKASALAHLPSGKCCANAAWLVCAVIAFNLTRAATTMTGVELARATTPTIRRTPISVPARIASSARAPRSPQSQPSNLTADIAISLCACTTISEVLTQCGTGQKTMPGRW